MAQVSKALPFKGQTDHLGRACRSTRVEPFTPTAMHKPTSTYMIGSSSIHVHQLISCVIDPSCTTCTELNTMLSLATNAERMMTNLRAELPGYGTVWFDPQAMRNVLSSGNIAKQYPIQNLQESDTFQVQTSDCINILASNRLIIYTFWKAINLGKNLQNLLCPKKMFSNRILSKSKILLVLYSCE